MIKQIGLPLRGRPILLITRMITDRIGLHSVLLPLLIIARNHWGVRTDSGPIAKVVASLARLARFLIEANWSRVKIALERV